MAHRTFCTFKLIRKQTNAKNERSSIALITKSGFFVNAVIVFDHFSHDEESCLRSYGGKCFVQREVKRCKYNSMYILHFYNLKIWSLLLGCDVGYRNAVRAEIGWPMCLLTGHTEWKFIEQIWRLWVITLIKWTLSLVDKLLKFIFKFSQSLLNARGWLAKVGNQRHEIAIDDQWRFGF